jgi:serine phosphatase RsbU (regulator of sigma subunit)
VTLWVGRFDPKIDQLTWASGGHPAGLLLSAEDDECTSLSATGPLLGALNDVVYGEQTVRMAANDALLLYTDGVTEARSGNAFFGEERVFAALRTGGSADEIAQRLLVSVRRFVRSELRDDVAVLVLRVRGRVPGWPREDIGEEGSANGD